jgi:hypothetical protein
MARRSLKPELNKIRAWVRQGRTDAWIAHQLDVTVQQIATFKRDNELAPDDGEANAEGFTEEIDLRAADDALVAAELEAAAEAEEAADEDESEEKDEDKDKDESEAKSDDGEAERPARGRRRGRRGGRGRRKGGGPLEGTFDHGEEGYGLWLDPAVQDDPVYAEHWAGHRTITVTVEEDQIVIRRSGDEDNGDDDE